MNRASAVISNPASIIDDMRGRIDAVIGPLLPVGGVVVLLDYPRYINVGDGFIWMGTQSYLRSRGLTIHAEIHARNCSTGALKRIVGDRPIVLQGGGNFGDLFRVHQAFRAEVVTAFPRQRIIMCPQTFHYQDPTRIAVDRAVYEGHSDLHLVWRDHVSLEKARTAFPSARHLVAPDMAFWMALPDVPTAPRPEGAPMRILYHARRDTPPERLYDLARIAYLGSTTRLDWREVITGLDDHKTLVMRVSALRNLLTGVDACLGSRLLPAVMNKDTSTYQALVRQWLLRAVECYASFDVVLTNRLHGHMLATLLRKPHVIVDTVYGKLDWYHQSWTHADGTNRRVSDYDAVPTALAEVMGQVSQG